MSDDTTIPVLPDAATIAATAAAAAEAAKVVEKGDEWTPPSKEEWEKLQEERDNYKKGLLSAKKEEKKSEPKLEENVKDYITRGEFDKMNERSAIQEMVTKNSDLKEHWEECMIYYYPKKGKATADDIKSDLQDALDLWRVRKNLLTPTTKGGASTLVSGSPQRGQSPAVSDKKTEPKNSADSKFLNALKSYGVDTSKI